MDQLSVSTMPIHFKSPPSEGEEDKSEGDELILCTGIACRVFSGDHTYEGCLQKDPRKVQRGKRVFNIFLTIKLFPFCPPEAMIFCAA